jgi:hypothetical protein
LSESDCAVVVLFEPEPDDLEPPWLAASAAPPPPNAAAATTDAIATLRVGRNTCYLLSSGTAPSNLPLLRGSPERVEKSLRV